MNKVNYQKKLDEIIKKITDEKNIPSLLLHSCCAPCSSYVLFYLSEYFKITVFYYNPNIYPVEEYLKRLFEQKNFIKKLKLKNKIDFLEGPYSSSEFYKNYLGLENEPEKGLRCKVCCKLRLVKTADLAKKFRFDYFTTTLTVSPYKDSDFINNIGEELQNKYDVKFLYSDFKKKDGYKKSIVLSEEFNLYRQHYCGCKFSLI